MTNDSVVNLCRNLIREKSYSGEEGGVVEAARKFWNEQGFEEFSVDCYGNCIATIRGDRPGKELLFDAHIDTVPAVADQWSVDPWSAELKDGKIYGRGTSDMKGAFAAMLWAAASFYKSTGGKFSGAVHVAGVVHEECFEGIAARKISEVLNPTLVVIGEASQLNLKIGQRGRAEILVETFGKNAHSANPEKGRNAVYDMAKLIPLIQALPCEYQEELGKGILELTDIKSLPYPGASVVPDYCRATFDRRLLVGETPDSVLTPIRKIVEELMAEDSEFKAEVSLAVGKERCHTGITIEGERFFPGWYFPESSDFVQTALKGIRSAGIEPEITTYSFCTNGSHYAGEAKIPTIGFGPSRENLAHTVDEYIEVEQLVKVCEGYEGIIGAFLFE
ncbi:MAG: YgeY family selenium metabolism-linked hydrolase [Spirochaetales bacterium]|nr:YgeY family selenium metabolism-linked hydrolase [Spirochaetales bacterium]